MPRFAPALAVLVVILTGCGSSPKTVSRNQISRLVLQKDDVPRVFQQFDFGSQVRADNTGTVRSDPTRNGRQGGWKARYRRGGSPTTSGPLVIESRVDIFKSGDGATRDVADYRKLFESLGAHMIAAPKLGEASFAVVMPGPAGVLATKTFAIAWREKNVSADVTIQGFAGHLAVGEVVALARKQEGRIAAVLKQ